MASRPRGICLDCGVEKALYNWKDLCYHHYKLRLREILTVKGIDFPKRLGLDSGKRWTFEVLEK